ncbi:MAG: 50S ribosomal protein L4, partial [Elusimicrobia bacterium]|nr:50S ribosomal protein L4 [Elusimicrobiota bacterium]
KPWKQKHTGRARAGSTRSPLWRHGGITFGPKPRSYYQPVPASKRQLVLRAVLSDFVREERLKVVDAFDVTEPKTKKVADIIKKLGWPEKTILVTDEISGVLSRAARNVADVRICRAMDLNSYVALLAEQLVFTRAALEQVSQRLMKSGAPAKAS